MPVCRGSLLSLVCGPTSTGRLRQRPVSLTTTPCTEWLQCYVGCRDAQYARGDDQALDQDERHQLCMSECSEIRGEIDSFPVDFDLALRNPEDVGFFWESTLLCLNDGA